MPALIPPRMSAEVGLPMRVNFVSYLSPLHYSGGGEMITRALIEGAPHRGVEVGQYAVRPRVRRLLADPDLTILCDVYNSPDGWRKMSRRFLSRVVREGRYVHFDNAYVDCCNMPYLPCSGNSDPRCLYKNAVRFRNRLARRDFGHRCFQERPLVSLLYQNSVANVFLSPLHRDTVCGMLAADPSKSIVMKPLIDFASYRPMGTERDINYLFVGAIGEAKGYHAMKERFSQQPGDLTMIGALAEPVDVSFANYLGRVDQAELPAYYNSAKNFVFLPRWPEPQGRVVAEAALCGCSLVTNENVGATSFGFDLSDPLAYGDPVAEFWRAMERAAALKASR